MAEVADFEDFMRNRAQPNRNPNGTSVGATECACGAKKGVARWARMSRGKPQGAKCWDCGSSTEWKRKVGYTNKTRTARENRKTTFKKTQRMIATMRQHTATDAYAERIERTDSLAQEFEPLEQQSTRVLRIEHIDREPRVTSEEPEDETVEPRVNSEE